MSEAAVLDALRGGDERAFEDLVKRHHATMVRVARHYVPTRELAEEVVQETWLVVLRSIDAFEGRSSLRTWIFRILMNRAKTRGSSERRTVPIGSAGDEEGEQRWTVRPERFLAPGDRWSDPPSHWDELPESTLSSKETMAAVEAALDLLPLSQRAVFVLRDMQYWSAVEVCEVLDLTEGNQRVLLHRARARLRNALEEHFREF